MLRKYRRFVRNAARARAVNRERSLHVTRENSMFKLDTLAATIFFFLAGGAAAQVLKGPAAFGDWQSDKPGVRRLLTVQDLPPPSAPTYGVAEVIPMPAGAKPQVPDGFSVEAIVSGLKNPRAMRVAPNGDLFVAQGMANQVDVYRLGANGKPSSHEVFAADLFQPYGMAFYPAGPNPQWIYIANSNSVVRFAYKSGDMKAKGKAETIVSYIPASHHWTRDIAFTPDGKRLLLSVGSSSNVALDMFPEPHVAILPKPHTIPGGLKQWMSERPLGAAWDNEELRADVLSVDPLGRDMQIYATGLRNCAGLTIQPATGQPWCVVNERDEIGDNTPFEYATAVKEGAFYGWPWYYNGGNEDPRKKGARPDLKDKVTLPDVLMQAHSAPLQIAFNEGSAFPAEYRGAAFVAMHGSWNRDRRTGYKVVYLPFKDGKATGEYVDFMTGFVTAEGKVWGRPVGVAIAKDGALLVSDDGSNTIWRVARK
jgi:glucose/arabinose dehydrogenase